MRTRIILAITLLWTVQGWEGNTFASTVSTRASLASGALRAAVSAHLEAGGKIMELSQESLAKYIKRDVADDMAQGDFWARFQLLPNQQVNGPRVGEKIIAVMAFQVSEEKRETVGRYVLLSDEHGVQVEWLGESDLVRLFSEARVPLSSKGVWQQAHAKLQSNGAESKPDPAQQKAMNELRRAELIAQDEGRPPQSKETKIPQIEQPPSQTLPSNSVTQIRNPQATKAQASGPSHSRPESTPWFVWVVMIAAAIGLLWLVFKRRAK